MGDGTLMWRDKWVSVFEQIVLPGILRTGDKSNSMILPLRIFSFPQTCMADCISIGVFPSQRPDEIGCLKQQLKVSSRPIFVLQMFVAQSKAFKVSKANKVAALSQP